MFESVRLSADNHLLANLIQSKTSLYGSFYLVSFLLDRRWPQFEEFSASSHQGNKNIVDFDR